MERWTFTEYQQEARQTAKWNPQQVAMGPAVYCALGLAGETGEVSELVKKLIRDDAGKLSPERRTKIIKELGDVLWYLTNLAVECEVSLEEVARENIAKIRSRQVRGVLCGSGSER